MIAASKISVKFCLLAQFCVLVMKEQKSHFSKIVNEQGVSCSETTKASIAQSSAWCLKLIPSDEFQNQVGHSVAVFQEQAPCRNLKALRDIQQSTCAWEFALKHSNQTLGVNAFFFRSIMQKQNP